MPAPLDSFIACQNVTWKKAGFSYQKIADELGLKAKSTAQSVFRRYNKNKSYLPKKIHWSSSKVIGKKPKENWSKMFSKIPKQLMLNFSFFKNRFAVINILKPYCISNIFSILSEFWTLYSNYIAFTKEEAEVRKQALPFVPARYIRLLKRFPCTKGTFPERFS